MFEVTASSTDATRAVVQPRGDMDTSNVHLLTSVLAGQLRLGRRFVRLDLSRTTVSDRTCLDHLVPTHEHFLAARGLLALTNVDAKLAPLLHSSQLDGTLFITDGPGPGPANTPPGHGPGVIARRLARGFRSRTNYRLRMILAADRQAHHRLTHPISDEPFRARRAIAVAQRLHRCWIHARKATYLVGR